MSPDTCRAIIFVAHAWPAHTLGAYGCEWISTPAFDQFASQSMLLERAYTTDPSPTTFRQFQIKLFETLRNQGIQVIPLFDVRKNEPDEKGHQSLEEALLEAEKHPKSLVWGETDQLAPSWKVNRKIFDQYAEDCGGLTEGSEQIEELAPVTKPSYGSPLSEPERHQLRCTLAAMVTAWDNEFGGAMGLLQERGWDKNALCIVCGANGQDLGEQGQVNLLTLHEQGVHVPFFFRSPEMQEGEGRRVSGMWSLDVLATLLQHSFSQAIGEKENWASWLESQKKPAILCQDGHNSALRIEEWVLFEENGEKQLFKKPDDYWEMSNVLARLVDWSEELTNYRTRFVECLEQGLGNSPTPPNFEDWLTRQEDKEELATDKHG